MSRTLVVIVMGFGFGSIVGQSQDVLSASYQIPKTKFYSDVELSKTKGWGVEIAYKSHRSVKSTLGFYFGGSLEFVKYQANYSTERIETALELLISQESGVYDREQVNLGLPVGLFVSWFESRLTCDLSFTPELAVLNNNSLDKTTMEFFRELPGGQFVPKMKSTNNSVVSSSTSRFQLTADIRVEYRLLVIDDNEIGVFVQYGAELIKRELIYAQRQFVFSTGISVRLN